MELLFGGLLLKNVILIFSKTHLQSPFLLKSLYHPNYNLHNLSFTLCIFRQKEVKAFKLQSFRSYSITQLIFRLITDQVEQLLRIKLLCSNRGNLFFKSTSPFAALSLNNILQLNTMYILQYIVSQYIRQVIHYTLLFTLCKRHRGVDHQCMATCYGVMEVSPPVNQGNHQNVTNRNEIV